MLLDCWQFDTNDIAKDQRDILECYISDSESSRASRFVFDNDRKRFVSRRGILRYILSSYIDVSPSQIAYKITKYGRPIVPASPYQFGLSSTDGKVVILIGRNIEFGVDIEKIKPLKDLQSLIISICSEEEQAWLSLFDTNNERENGVYILWTIKEAYLKMRGHGLFVDPRKITVKTEELCPNGWRILGCGIEKDEISIAPITGHLPKGLIGHVVARSKKQFSITHKHLLHDFT